MSARPDFKSIASFGEFSEYYRYRAEPAAKRYARILAAAQGGGSAAGAGAGFARRKGFLTTTSRRKPGAAFTVFDAM